jgi:hypothetical protein
MKRIALLFSNTTQKSQHALLQMEKSLREVIIQLKDFIYKHADLIVISVILVFVSYGYELFNFSLSIDEELDSFRKSSSRFEYIKNGRWGLYILIQLLNPTSVLPYYPTLIGLLSLAGCSVLFVSGLRTGMAGKLLFSIIFITSPVHSFYLSFNTVGFIYPIGMMMASISYKLVIYNLERRRPGFILYFLAALLLAILASFVQSVLLLFPVFAIFYMFDRVYYSKVVRWKELLVNTAIFAVVFAGGLIIYKVVDISAKQLFIPAHLKNNTEYLDNFIHWGKVPVMENLMYLFNRMWGYLIGSSNTLGSLGIAMKLLIALIAAAFVSILLSKKTALSKMLLVALLCVLLWSPFALMFATGGALPQRTFMAYPLMMAAVWLIVYRAVPSYLQKIILVAAFLVLINNTFINTRLFYAAHTSWQADRDMANRIVERIYSLDPPAKNGRIKVAFIGMYRHDSNELFFHKDTHGASFFSWNQGVPGRMKSLLRTAGINTIDIVHAGELSNYTDIIANMSGWPDKGAVKVHEDIVFVKLSMPQLKP